MLNLLWFTQSQTFRYVIPFRVFNKHYLKSQYYLKVSSWNFYSSVAEASDSTILFYYIPYYFF